MYLPPGISCVPVPDLPAVSVPAAVTLAAAAALHAAAAPLSPLLSLRSLLPLLLQASGCCRTGQLLLLLRQHAHRSREQQPATQSHAETRCKVRWGGMLQGSQACDKRPLELLQTALYAGDAQYNLRILSCTVLCRAHAVLRCGDPPCCWPPMCI